MGAHQVGGRREETAVTLEMWTELDRGKMNVATRWSAGVSNNCPNSSMNPLESESSGRYPGRVVSKYEKAVCGGSVATAPV